MASARRLIARSTGGFHLAVAVLGIALLSACAAPGGAARAADLVWDYSPYRVQLWVALDDVPELSSRTAAQLVAGLAARSESTIGALWDLSVQPAPADLAPRLLEQLESLNLAALEGLDTVLDKVLVVSLRREDGGYRLVARDWDQRCRCWSHPLVAQVTTRAELLDGALRLAVRAFAPLAQVDEVEGRLAKIRLRGGQLPIRDSSIPRGGETGLFQPIVRVNSREGTLQHVRPVEWTLLEVTEAVGGALTCKMHSGLRGALGDRRKGRVERLALAIPPVEGGTRLAIHATGAPDQPLPGYRVLGYTSDSKTTEPIGTTDARGEIWIPPAVKYLRLLLVLNGNQALAKLPLVPGLAPRVAASVADDNRRLEVEGFVAGLQESMVDLVVRREVLIALAQQKIDAGQVEAAQSLIEELRVLPTRQQFAFRVTQEEQRLAGDTPRVKRRVERLFNDTRTLLSQYLDPRAVEVVENNFVKLKNRPPAAESEADGPGQPPPETPAETPATSTPATPPAGESVVPTAAAAGGGEAGAAAAAPVAPASQ